MISEETKAQQNFPNNGSSQHCSGKLARPQEGKWEMRWFDMAYFKQKNGKKQ